MIDISPRPGISANDRMAELKTSIPFARVRNLATETYKKPDGQPIMEYSYSLNIDRQIVYDAVLDYEVKSGLVVSDGSVSSALPPPPPTQAPTMTTVVTPPPAAEQPSSSDAPRVSRRRQAQNGAGVAPPPAPAPVPLEASPDPVPPRTPVQAFSPPAPPPTPVAPAASLVFSPPTPVAFVPPAPAPTPVSISPMTVDLGPVLQGLQSLGVGVEAAVKNSDAAMKKAVDLDAKTDHMMFVLYHLFAGMYSQTLAQNKIASFSDFKKYVQAISTPQ